MPSRPLPEPLPELSAVTDSLASPLERFSAPVRAWFRSVFGRPTRAQAQGWRSILENRSTLLLSPTGSGKTLAAFLAAIDRIILSPPPDVARRCRVLYVSPLKALAVDVERNLRSPIAGIAACAETAGLAFHAPAVAIRSGDTPAAERARMARRPPDILITTPESLYLVLTSAARRMLASVETVIVDEIHSIASSKRGAHLALSLERLESLRSDGSPPLQRIGLSATQRPLEEVARLLGGGTVTGDVWLPRDVDIVDAGSRNAIDLTIEVPVEDMSRPEKDASRPPPAATSAPPRRSVWPSIHRRLAELVRAHRSTMIFVNSRRLGERLATALNEEAGEEIALAHHGSVARETRLEIEDRLKRGDLPSIVATSSMELGIDMGAVDLVIQVEAPPSIASGLQRIGRSNHAVGETPRGVIFPRHRGDLLPCAAAATSMLEGKVEESRYPRNPLDVLAQQIVAITAVEEQTVDDLYDLVRHAAPFADLPLSALESVLDMLSGRYPSEEFSGLRARVTWNRLKGTLKAREGAQAIAVSSGGTIPDRGLYGVFLAGDDSRRSRRVGELDEEMVFETHPGDVFLLGASSWRVEQITHDRVIVSPAPGEPGKMPFWHGDRPGRRVDFGRAIGRLARELSAAQPDAARERLESRHGMDGKAAAYLVAYLADQAKATGEVPSDRAIIVERYLDEVGDWRLSILSPFGAAVHAPWAMAATEQFEKETGLRVDTLWSDDGMVFRVPETGEPPDISMLLPDPDNIEELVVRRLSSTVLFAARFRENAARALLLPRRRPGRRNPLWVQRKRSSDLLSVAARYPSFPIILETYRECLRDVFDLPALVDLLRQLRSRRIRVVAVDSRTPSPFASSLLFSYVSNFIYEGDAPLAERRARTLGIDQAQLRELLGEAELRELLDAKVIEEVEISRQRLDGERTVRHPDGVHDLLLELGALSREEIESRCEAPAVAKDWIESLAAERRIFALRMGPEERWAAAEDAARLRDALGVELPPGMPAALLEPVSSPLDDLVSRYARAHGPFTAREAAARLGLQPARVEQALERLESSGRIVGGSFLAAGRGREWCDGEVLRLLKRRSLSRLRAEIDPVDPPVLACFLLDWQGVTRPRRGVQGVLDAIDQLQGCPLVASALESEILPARVADYEPWMLDELCASGELIWRGIDPIGESDGRIALYPRQQYPLLTPESGAEANELGRRLLEILERGGASFFAPIAAETGAFRADLLAALWDLVWAGRVTNDTLAPLRSRLRSSSAEEKRRRGRTSRLRRCGAPPGSEGRWSLLPRQEGTETERRTALVQTLLERYGILTREAVLAEGVAGGFAAVYPVLKAMEEAGRIRRGYFVSALGAAQFARGGADDRLRQLRTPPSEDADRVLVLSAVDPAQPYGSIIPWPSRQDARLERRAGAKILLWRGEPVAYLGRSERDLVTLLPDREPWSSRASGALAHALSEMVESGGRRALLIASIDGEEPARSPLAAHLQAQGFRPGSAGYLRRAAAGPFSRPRPWLETGDDGSDAEDSGA
ncbi:MAG: DEAD/DEAH box helicase [Planctomycetes bacterium]|nr:DEAD/DEAH box helicase [Planctomycetota bacterium]